VRRRNSSLILSKALVVRSAFHCNLGNCKKVNSSSPASSGELTTALQRSRRHLRKKPTCAVSGMTQSDANCSLRQNSP
jgi:hypothetical protein